MARVVQAQEGSRRQRLRSSTQGEILDTARALLLEAGPGAVSLRAIARRMGMTAPGLYRYYASHEQLVEALVARLYAELTEELERSRDAAPAQDAGGRLLATARAFRSWGRSHPAELGLLFGAPVPGIATPEEGEAHRQGRRFGQVFLELIGDLWAVRPFPVPDEADLDPGLVADVRAWLPPEVEVPLGAAVLYLRCWMRLYGAVTMEVFGHVAFAVGDAGPLFEAELRELGALLGLEQPVEPLPGATARV